ncbi:response regulator transcription factor [Dyella caseinilytica]|uniref:Response regulator transcription factor n=1 Tax=Dyella caseinilytica TaxID=1849581 RepID=A0ABX7GYR4_9GAMM|nr:response regulator transcription factor [Dyella caseinilytica]QRN55643.1 response regulator transcription factor [Dyella caseinilytica]GGA03362.1 DNA-binding response regulator [Dyella caseinilytica]
MDTKRIRIVIADDHPIILLGIQACIEEIFSYQIVGTAQNPDELIHVLNTTLCDVVVTDYVMPGSHVGDGLELIDVLKRDYPSIGIVMVTAIDKPAIIGAMMARGVENIISKTDDLSHVVPAIQSVLVKRRYLSPSIERMPREHSTSNTTKLSPREREVIALYLKGKTITEIAATLNIRKQTASGQKSSAMSKLGFMSDADLFQHAADLELWALGDDD